MTTILNWAYKMVNNFLPSFTLGFIASELKLDVLGNKDKIVHAVHSPFESKKGDISYYTRDFSLKAVLEYLDINTIPILTTVLIPNADCILCKEKEFYKKLDSLLKLFARVEVCVTSKSSNDKNIVIADNVQLGNNITINPNVTIYPEVIIGDNCIIHSGAIIRGRVQIGDNVIIGSNTTVGSSGFLYHDTDSSKQAIHYAGSIIIKNNTIIGDNCCIDAPRYGATIIGEYVRIGSQVLVSHGASIGNYCLIVGQAAIAGDVQVGAYVYIGGGAGISNGIRIGDRAKIIARSVIVKDVKTGVHIGGFFPSLEKNKFLKLYNKLKQFTKT